MAMNKNLLSYLLDADENSRTDQQASRASESAPHMPSRLQRLLRWLMPNGGTIVIVLILIFTQSAWARSLNSPENVPGPNATTINYQGRLADAGGAPLTGTYGMVFALYDAVDGGNLVWGPENHAAVPVSDGLFSVGLGGLTSGGIPTSVWNGDRYLEITVDGETLAPRELIGGVPVASMALTVPDGAIGSTQIADGAVGSVQIADGAINSADISIGAAGSQQMAPTFFYSEYTSDDELVVDGCNTSVVELSVNFPVDANYLIVANMHTMQTVADKRSLGYLRDESGNRMHGVQLVAHHSVAGYDGSSSVTGMATHYFSAGAHQVFLEICSSGAPVKVRNNYTSILAIPFAVAP